MPRSRLSIYAMESAQTPGRKGLPSASTRQTKHQGRLLCSSHIAIFTLCQNKRSLSLEWPRTPKAVCKCPKTSLWYMST